MLQVVTDFQSELNYAMEAAKAQSEQTGVQLASQAETQQQALDLFQQRSGFAIQEMVAAFHSHALQVSQSVEVANHQTSILVGKIADVSVGLDAPLQKIAYVNSGLDEASVKVQLMKENSDAALESLVESKEIAGGLLSTLKALWKWSENFGLLGVYFVGTYLAALICWGCFISRYWASTAAFPIAIYLSVFFVYIHSPGAFVRSVIAHHPVIFSPVIWSVLTSFATGILLWEIARWACRSISRGTNDDDYQLRLPINQYEKV